MSRFSLSLLAVLVCLGNTAAHATSTCATSGNQPPKAADYTDKMPTTFLAIDVVRNSVDPDGDPLTLLSVGSAGTSGQTSRVDSRQAGFTPAAGATGATFSYTIADSKGDVGQGTVYLGTDVPPVQFTVTPSCTALVCDFAMVISPAHEALGASFDWSVRNAVADGNSRTSYRSPIFTVTLNSYDTPYVVSIRGKTTSGIAVSYDNATFRPPRPKVDATLAIATNGGRNVSIAVAATTTSPTGQTQCLSTESATFYYDFGDGTGRKPRTIGIGGCPSLSQKTTYQYAQPGIYSMSAIIVNGGQESIFSEAVEIANMVPQPRIRATRDAVNPRLWRFTYDAATTLDDRPISQLRFEWAFGDGTIIQQGSLAEVVHEFPAGNHTVTLTAIDDLGASGQDTYAVSIPNNPPSIVFAAQCLQYRDCHIRADVADADSAIREYQWTTEGETWSTVSSSTTFRYPTDGTKIIQLTVTDAAGASTATSRVVHVDTAPRPSPLAFFALPPCRAYNSMQSAPWVSNQGKTVTLAAACGVPTDAVAAELNVSAVAATGAGHLLSITAGGAAAGTLVNFNANDPRANNATVLLSNGSFQILPYVSAGSPATVHVVVDVTGYWAPTTVSYNPLATGPLYMGVSSCTVILDATIPNGVTQFSAGCGMGTTTMRALWATILATQPTAGGHITAFRKNDPMPATSFMNFPAGRSIMNSGVVRTADTGMTGMALAYGALQAATVRVRVDAWAYFGQSLNEPELGYVPIKPCRSLDTRLAEHGMSRTGNDEKIVTVHGNCGIPANAVAVRMNVAVINPESDAELHINRRLSGYVKAGEVFSTGIIRRLMTPATNPVLPYQNITLKAVRPENTADPVADADFVADVVGYFVPVNPEFE